MEGYSAILVKEKEKKLRISMLEAQAILQNDLMNPMIQDKEKKIVTDYLAASVLNPFLDKNPKLIVLRKGILIPSIFIRFKKREYRNRIITINDGQGQLLYDPQKIKELFEDYYEELLNNDSSEAWEVGNYVFKAGYCFTMTSN